MSQLPPAAHVKMSAPFIEVSARGVFNLLITDFTNPMWFGKFQGRKLAVYKAESDPVDATHTHVIYVLPGISEGFTPVMGAYSFMKGKAQNAVAESLLKYIAKRLKETEEDDDKRDPDDILRVPDNPTA